MTEAQDRLIPFISGIVSGAYDDALDQLIDAIKQRRSTVRQQASYTNLLLKPGTRVRLKGLSPKYLNGLTGTIGTVQRGKRLTVKLDTPVKRFGSTVQPPASCVEAI